MPQINPSSAKSILAVLAFVGTSGVGLQAASLVAISDLFNTGVDATGAPLADDTPDGHYAFVSTPGTDPNPPGPLAATAAGGFPIGAWMGDNPTSAWIVPRPDATGNVGNYIYRTTFTIPVGVDPSQVFIRGMGTSDNATSGVLVNGVSTGVTFSGNFPAFDPQFTIQGPFQVGVNTIDFVVNEASGSVGAGGFSGLRVEMAGSHAPVGAVAIPGLFNTGVDATGVPLADNAVDSHWIITNTPTGPASDPTFAATAAGGFPIGPWLGDNSHSSWLAPAVDTNGLEGFFEYSINFDLTGLDTATASIVGGWALDNFGHDIFLNGVSTGNSNGNGFGGFTDFSVAANEGDVFLPGVNTLTFRVENGPGAGPTGLRVEFYAGSASPIPEPGAVALLSLALLIVAGRRSRHGR